MDIITRHQLQIPPNLFLMVKAITTVEGVGMMLDPEFDYTSLAAPFIKRIRMERMHPKRIADDMLNFSTQIIQLLKEIPGEVRDIIQLAKSGHSTIRIEHHGLTPAISTLDRVSNRVSFAIVLASLIIGSGLIVLSGIPPRWQDIPVIGIIGFLGAGIMGFWLLISILRHGRM